MCTKLQTPPDGLLETSMGPGDNKLIAPSDDGVICRFADDSAGLLLCRHGDGRSEVHYMEPGSALADDEIVMIEVLTAWPVLVLEDRKS